MLRDITYWVLDVLENAGLHASLTAGALLGVVRDGGVLISADTDVDIAVCPEDKDKVGNNTAPAAAALRATRTSFIGVTHAIATPLLIVLHLAPLDSTALAACFSSAGRPDRGERLLP